MGIMADAPDDTLDDKLKALLKERADRMVFSQAMQDKVLERVKARPKGRSGSEQWLARRRRARRLRLRLGAAAGAAVAVLLFAFAVRLWGAPGQHTAHTMFSAHMGAIQSSASSATGTAAISATLAPVASQNTTIIPGIPTSRQIASAVGIKERASAYGAVSGPATASNKGRPGSAIRELAPQAFTVATVLVNNSNAPINGRNMQGMLFIVNGAGQLTPSQASDWEYFVDGPNQVIPPHKAVLWYFTPNPSPPFHHLSTRTAHLVWFLRQPNASYPTVRLGAQPVSVSNVHVSVTGTGGGKIKMQYLRVTASLHNNGSRPWAMKSSLGMLFFTYRPGASLLSRGTWKYFDDIAPANGSPSVIPPGGTATTQFIITGVPGANMTRLPLSILLVNRRQLGA